MIKKMGFPTPGMIVVGDVAAFRAVGEDVLPLSGATVAVTGTKPFVSRTCRLLRKQGANAVPVCCIKTVETDAALPSNFDSYDWLVFTSQNGVRFFFEKFDRAGFDIRSLSHMKLACVGQATADTLKEYRLTAELVPSKASGEALGEALARRPECQDSHILIACAAHPARGLSDALEAAGLSYEELGIYDVVSEKTIDEMTDLDYLVFSSGSSVRAYASQHRIEPSTKTICIGAHTAKVLRDETNMVGIVAKKSSAEGIVEEIIENYAG